MNCKRIQELIPLFVESDLDSRREKLVSDHVMRCELCRHVVSEFRESQSWLQSYVPREFDRAYFQSIGEEVWARIEEEDEASIGERIVSRFRSVQLPIAV